MPPSTPPHSNGSAEETVTPAAVVDRLVESLCTRIHPGRLLVSSDFDGTLAPIVARPGGAAAQPGSLAALERLVQLGVMVAVISGRSGETLRRVVPVDGVELLGDYGLEEATPEELLALHEFNERVLELFVDVDGIVVEPKPGSTSVHYRDNPEAGPQVYDALAPLAAGLGLRAGRGRMVVEVRPFGADKGLALGRLIERHRPEAVAFAGDDEGDRSAFAVAARSGLRHLTVGVISPEAPPGLFSECDAVISGPGEWTRILTRIAARLGGG
ncbi:MAG TPA: trehalose-phosphatase [Candidatus Dormibacteraeota bacterium]